MCWFILLLLTLVCTICFVLLNYPHSDAYEGEYAHNRRNGFGKYFYHDGSYYEGNWRDNLKHGEGFYRWCVLRLDVISHHVRCHASHAMVTWILHSTLPTLFVGQMEILLPVNSLRTRRRAKVSMLLCIRWNSHASRALLAFCTSVICMPARARTSHTVLYKNDKTSKYRTVYINEVIPSSNDKYIVAGGKSTPLHQGSLARRS